MQEVEEARACLKKAFCKMCVTICGRFRSAEGAVAGYGNRIRVKSPAKWGVQIAGMIFQTRSSMNSFKILEHELSFSLKLEIIKALLSIYYSMRKEMSRNDKTYSDKESDHRSGNPENLRSSYWNHQRKNLPGSRGCQKSSGVSPRISANASSTFWQASGFISSSKKSARHSTRSAAAFFASSAS